MRDELFAPGSLFQHAYGCSPLRAPSFLIYCLSSYVSRNMANPFFDHPIPASPYDIPRRHWELDETGQPTQQLLETRRRADFITPIPKPKKHRKAAQGEMVFDEGKGLSTKAQQYDPTSIINEVRQNVNAWRGLPIPSQWQVTPETARLLQHWRHHKFSSMRPFFCQV